MCCDVEMDAQWAMNSGAPFGWRFGRCFGFRRSELLF
jgi:hypothetical protein